MKNTISDNITSYIWKDKEGNIQQLVNMSKWDLINCYKHSVDMLTNTVGNPGKYIIKDTLQKLYALCNVELFTRYILNIPDGPFSTKKDILDFISKIKENNDTLSNQHTINYIFDNLQPVYNSITINDLLNSCFDKLGYLNRKLISDKFIYQQGIWFTSEEQDELTEIEQGQIRNRLEVMKERLGINPQLMLQITPKGLSYNEFRSLIQLPSYGKLSNLTTSTLQLLRDKIILRLEHDLKYHIEKWESIKKQIEEVAEYNGIILNE